MNARLHPRAPARPGRQLALGWLLAAGLLLAGCAPTAPQSWALTDIKGYLPDLAFKLQTAGDRTVTAADYQGKVVVLYFGYTHCPDVCPMTLGRLAEAVRDLGDEAKDVQIVFVSVDPYRDTPALLEQYAKAFSPRAVGVTGKPAEIERLAKVYRVAYEREKPDGDGGYEVMHSKAVYLFDRGGHARLMGTDTDSAKAFAHDLRQLVAEKS